ncbi:MAG: orotate phosphoribosyltransferase [Opitutales bacterium]
MDNQHAEVLKIFEESGALLKGHFALRSGMHSEYYFQCAQVCQYMDSVERLAELLLKELSGISFETVLAPAIGGLVIGQEVARQSRSRFIFAEKENDRLVLRRGFKIKTGEKILVVEDVVTRGGRAREAIHIVRAHGGEPVALAVLVDRSSEENEFDLPMAPLVKLSFPAYPPDALPDSLKRIPVEKPGS